MTELYQGPLYIDELIAVAKRTNLVRQDIADSMQRQLDNLRSEHQALKERAASMEALLTGAGRTNDQAIGGLLKEFKHGVSKMTQFYQISGSTQDGEFVTVEYEEYTYNGGPWPRLLGWKTPDGQRCILRLVERPTKTPIAHARTVSGIGVTTVA